MLRTRENTKSSTVSGTPPPNYKGTVIARFIEQKFSYSSSDNPMITLTSEILSPATVKCDFDGKDYAIEGQQFKMYIILTDTDSKGKPFDSLDHFTNTLLPLLNMYKDYDDEDPLKTADNPEGLDFIDKTFEVVVSTEQRKEFKKLPNGESVPVLDAAGKEIIRGWQWKSDMKSILRLATIETNRAF